MFDSQLKLYRALERLLQIAGLSQEAIHDHLPLLDPSEASQRMFISVPIFLCYLSFVELNGIESFGRK